MFLQKKDMDRIRLQKGKQTRWFLFTPTPQLVCTCIYLNHFAFIMQVHVCVWLLVFTNICEKTDFWKKVVYDHLFTTSGCCLEGPMEELWKRWSQVWKWNSIIMGINSSLATLDSFLATEKKIQLQVCSTILTTNTMIKSLVFGLF